MIIGRTLVENFDWRNSTISFTSIKISSVPISLLIADFAIPPTWSTSPPCSGMWKALMMVELNVSAIFRISQKWATHLDWDLQLTLSIVMAVAGLRLNSDSIFSNSTFDESVVMISVRRKISVIITLSVICYICYKYMQSTFRYNTKVFLKLNYFVANNRKERTRECHITTRNEITLR